MPLSPDQQPQFYPVHPVHPEFGYLVPALPLRRKAWLVCKATVLGAVIGAVGMIALWPDRDAARVEPLLVTEAIAVPMDTGASPPAGLATAKPAAPAPGYALASASGAEPPPLEAVAAPAEPIAAPTPPPAKSAPSPKPKKKQVARPKPQNLRPPAEIDARSAYASPYGHTFQQPRREWNGWQGGFGDRSFGW